MANSAAENDLLDQHRREGTATSVITAKNAEFFLVCNSMYIITARGSCEWRDGMHVDEIGTIYFSNGKAVDHDLQAPNEVAIARRYFAEHGVLI